MRVMIKMSLAGLLVGASLAGAAGPVLAGADDGGNKAFWMESRSANPATADSRRDNGQYTARYAPESAVQSKAVTPDKDPPSFYHAMGSMGVP